MTHLYSSGILPLLTVFLSLLWTKYCTGHPQCLDFRPPFPSEPPLEFCVEYSKFGCCTAVKDRALAERYRETLAQAPANKAGQCGDALRQVICQECSPYAAHVFDSEADGIAASLPGLCGPFCSTFYDACKDIMPHLIGDSTFSLEGMNKNTFCQSLQITDMDYCYPDLLTNPIFNANLNRTAVTVDGCLCLEEFARDLRSPLSFEPFPDGTGRILVSEQIGVIHVYYKNGTKIKSPFMDLSDVVLTSSWKGDERGFLGLTFHPNFEENGKFYCYFSVKNNNKQKIQISEFKISDENPNKVNGSTERVLLQVDQPYWNHNGGEILFGVDGYLYLFLGDGGSAGDPGNRAQNKDLLLGKVLRIDVNVEEGSNVTYHIPPDNPFVGVPNTRPEIYAYGIRNIWRCDLDEGDPITGYGRGRIFCGDVGQSAYEEIDLIEKGGNYGWNSREGFECFKAETCGKIGEEVLPIYAYSHSVGKSVTGGHVYRGCLSPSLAGAYIYGDYVRGRLFKLEETAPGGTWSNQELTMCGDDVCFNGLVNKYEKHIMSFGEDDDGEIYMLTTSEPITTQATGKIYKIVDPRRRGDPTTCRSYIIPTTTPPPTTPTTPTTTTTTATTSYIMTGEGTVPRPDLLITPLVITTCILLPFVTCVSELI